MIHQPFRHLTEVIPHISSFLRLLVLCLVRHTLLFIYFFRELISFIGFLDRCHTSVFIALNKLCTNKCFDPFPNDKFLDISKPVDFAGDNSKFDENGRKFSKWVENTVVTCL